jgi:nucleoside-diphosphate-sugar epimerase
MLTLVTGATGLVGNNVVRLLLERGEAVRVLQRDGADPRPLAGLNIEIARGDVRDAPAVRRACDGVQRVVHAAAYVHIGWANQPLQEAINVEGTRHVVAAAHEAKARLIYVSTVDTIGLGSRDAPASEDSAPDPRARVPYVVTKRAAELLVLEGVDRGLEAVIVNPVYMLGPWDWKPSSGRMLLRVARGRALLAPRGGNDFCDVRDVAAGIHAAASRGKIGRRYILGGEPWRYVDAWRVMAKVAGTRGPICRAGPIQLLVAGWAGDFWRLVSGSEPDVNSASITLSFASHHYSYERAATELGYRTRPLRETVTDAWQWFCEHGYGPRPYPPRAS